MHSPTLIQSQIPQPPPKTLNPTFSTITPIPPPTLPFFYPLSRQNPVAKLRTFSKKQSWVPENNNNTEGPVASLHPNTSRKWTRPRIEKFGEGKNGFGENQRRKNLKRRRKLECEIKGNEKLRKEKKTLVWFRGLKRRSEEERNEKKKNKTVVKRWMRKQKKREMKREEEVKL